MACVLDGWLLRGVRAKSRAEAGRHGSPDVPISLLRVLVIVSSLLQIGIGGYAAYRFLYVEVPDVFALMLCSAIIIAGLASLSGLCVRLRPSISRVATVKLNAVILALLILAGVLFMLIERHEGADATRLQMLGVVFGAFGLPFFINSISLAMIERRVRKLVT